MIQEIKSYIDNRGIEIQESSDIDGKAKPQYIAHVTIGVNTPDGGQMPQPISAKISAKDIKEAFEKADPALQAEIKKFQEDLKEETTKPKIITDF